MLKLILFLFGIIFLGECSAVSLPKYIKACSASDPKFDECGLQSGRQAIKHLINGEKSLHILPLSPLKLPFVQLENRADFQLNITEVEIHGLEKADLVYFHANLKDRKIKAVVYLSEILLKGQFYIDGRILILPLKANGPGSVKAYNGNYTYMVNYDLVKKGEVNYSKITKHNFEFDIEKVEFETEQWFGSDSTLGKETQKFLNENWREVIKDFEQVIGSTIGSICRNIASGLFERVPFEELILP